MLKNNGKEEGQEDEESMHDRHREGSGQLIVLKVTSAPSPV